MAPTLSVALNLCFFHVFLQVHVTLELRILAFDSEMLFRFRPLLKFNFVYEMCRYGFLDRLPLDSFVNLMTTTLSFFDCLQSLFSVGDSAPFADAGGPRG